MPDPVVEALIFDLLNWLNRGDRTYDDLMNAWRTSCPKLPIWEEANDRALVEIETQASGERQLIRVSAAGHSFLAKHAAANRTQPLAETT